MSLLYRIEIDKEGFWQHDRIYKACPFYYLESIERQFMSFPGPSEDNALKPIWENLFTQGGREHYLFAFKSVEDIRKFVGSRMEYVLIKVDAKVLIIEPKKEAFVHIGDTQAIYHKDEVTVVSKLSIRSLNYLNRYKGFTKLRAS